MFMVSTSKKISSGSGGGDVMEKEEEIDDGSIERGKEGEEGKKTEKS
jgi:hypothetical protein